MSENNKKWFMVSSIGKLENKAKKSIEDLIKKQKKEALFGQIVVPEMEKTEVIKGVKKTKTLALFPNYFLVQMVPCDEAIVLVKSATHVTGFVGNTKSPTPISDAEAERMINQASVGKAALAYKDLYEVGQKVKIVDGPFNSFTGEVDSVKPDKQKIVVKVSVFGRETPVELSYSQVSKDKE